MWALRRGSNPLKNRGFSAGTSRSCCAKLELPGGYLEDRAGVCESPQVISDRCLSFNRFYTTTHVSLEFSMWRRSLSSQAGAKSNGEEDDLEDRFSELEMPATSGAIQDSNTEGEDEDEDEGEGEGEGEDELISGPELSDGDDEIREPSQNELELSDTEADPSEKRSPKRWPPSELFKAVVAAPGLSVHSALDKWVEEGKDLGRGEISLAMLNLQKCRMYGRALQLSEWLEANKHLDFVERDYACRVDLIAKVRGLPMAESYIEKIPKSFRGEVIYRTFLTNCVVANKLKKAEEVFNKMKDLDFPLTPLTCNQLLLLYKKLDRKKIADVLLLMEKENVKPTLFAYRLLIDTKGQSNDITGMDQIVETMRAEGIKPDIHTQTILARHYVNGGLTEKAEAVLKEMEGDNLKENRRACRSLLPLYAALGKADEVGRIWKLCESHPRIEECMAAIEAWGKLKKIEEAEAVFDRMLKTWKQLSSRQYAALLKVYANHKMFIKGKDLVKQMADSGCRIGPLTWDALVKLYVEAGEVEKADSILQKVAQQNQIKPMFSTYMVVMDQYAKRGDIHNSEKLFYRMRQAGYLPRLWSFQALVQAYVNAKAPAYGIRDRMRADNIFPSRTLLGQLVLVDAFRKTAVSDLLD